jgi:hypothetical protein
MTGREAETGWEKGKESNGGEGGDRHGSLPSSFISAPRQNQGLSPLSHLIMAQKGRVKDLWPHSKPGMDRYAASTLCSLYLALDDLSPGPALSMASVSLLIVPAERTWSPVAGDLSRN